MSASVPVSWGDVSIEAGEGWCIVTINFCGDPVSFKLDHDGLLDLLLAAKAAEPIVAGVPPSDHLEDRT